MRSKLRLLRWASIESCSSPTNREVLINGVAAVDEAHADHREWKSFSRRLVGVYRDAKQLHPQRAQMAAAAYDMSVARLEARIGALANENWEHPDTNRLAKRLIKHGNELLTFL